MEREPWHDSLLESLEVLADIPLQVRIWVEGDTTVFVESPTELVCQVFDDSAILELMTSGIVFSDGVDSVLREMDSLAARINLRQSPRVLLDDPDWRKLSGLARQAHSEIRCLLSLP